ncbi:MAG: 4-hydroxy-tetrahydrodipicolinate synthase, partial [Clostridia bacterium]|nr:4-hydroxy-tetrahydrodipicolinate synthase [Clostridia bacterium]
DTAYALELTQYACEVGVDAVLVVTPYYNKATQNGLIKLFTQIADVATAPVILYDVPSRTGVSLEPKTVAELAKHPNINAIKAACGNISKIAEMAALCGDEINIYSGNDDQVIPIMSLGGKGCISVLSNVLPKESSLMCKKFANGDVKGACEMQLKYLPLINALFSEVNPIPVKAAMAKMGFCEDYLRLPLTPMETAHKEILFAEMAKAGINI